jgi:hypothetical protein
MEKNPSSLHPESESLAKEDPPWWKKKFFACWVNGPSFGVAKQSSSDYPGVSACSIYRSDIVRKKVRSPPAVVVVVVVAGGVHPVLLLKTYFLI